MMKEQLRANRTHALNAWIGGSDMQDKNDKRFPRFEGDDGRSLDLRDHPFWSQKIKDAQQAEFNRLDAIFEKAKSKY